ncbi:hypothetical protein ASPFODRAFT_51551 [Aspergillus luchuensis CBS 106.47]|uniref:Uncharacterized protein n=1 Tax=Aspergillus luchuensis (strain CBS 106.47) TaxID=1137211 RepID=A0A1M3T532_ASPLC|nr:hypothetical protein ASPFODRAFT_51551 [Aspergillus luchuensis CBS 106.47]
MAHEHNFIVRIGEEEFTWDALSSSSKFAIWCLLTAVSTALTIVLVSPEDEQLSRQSSIQRT